MTSRPLVLGIDVGTSGTKVLVVDDSGAVLSSATADHPASSPGPGWSEQRPEDWITSVVEGIRTSLESSEVRAEDVTSIGLTGQMHGLVALDDSGAVIRDAILWNDQRSAEECIESETALGIDFLVRHTGNRMLPGFTAPKLLWMRKHEPEAYARIRHVLLPKDYVRLRLGSKLAMDVSDASGTSVFDCGRRTWSDATLEALGLPREWWPEVAESAEVVDALNPAMAKTLGLRPGLPLVAGAGDQAASAVGTGIVREGVVSATLGTSGVVFASSDTWRTTPDGSLHAFCHAVPDTWHLMGVMLSAAGSLDWFRKSVTPDLAADAHARDVDPFDMLCGLAADVPPGSEGLYFLPYLTGERTPHPDPNARGCFIGLTPGHGRAEMTRAVLEGVTFGMRDCLDLVRGTGVRPDVIRLSGGGAKGRFWRRLCAEVFDCTTATTTTTEGTAYGAALLAGVGSGFWPDVPAACDAVVRVVDTIDPGEDAGRYHALHARYRSLYPALSDWWSAG